MADLTRRQMRNVGLLQALSPVMDVARDARWGRVHETYGEDPYLVSAMSVAFTKGLQGADLRDGVIATAKHFLGYAMTEGGQNMAATQATARELREVYARPFAAAIGLAGLASIMNSYSEVDGIPVGASKEILTGLLRDELGFEGTVVSDYQTVAMLHSRQSVARDYAEAGALALAAGLDVELPAVVGYGSLLADQVRAGAVAEEVLDTAVRRVLRDKLALGLFERPYVDEDPIVLTETARQGVDLAHQLASESLTLLKNDGPILPLSTQVRRIAIVGPHADEVGFAFPGYTYPVALAMLGGIAAIGGRGGWFFGANTEGEGSDSADIELPRMQRALLDALAATGTPVVGVLSTGRPMALAESLPALSALMHAYYSGQQGTRAVAQALFGITNPGGKLPYSMPRHSGQVPIYAGQHNGSGYRRTASDMHKGYRDLPATPLFAFGHGLSYTSFVYSGLTLSGTAVESTGSIEISVAIENTGTVTGDEVVQLYVSDTATGLVRPAQELAGFRRVTLAPGEVKTVTFSVQMDQLGYLGTRPHRLRHRAGTHRRTCRVRFRRHPCTRKLRGRGSDGPARWEALVPVGVEGAVMRRRSGIHGVDG